MMTSTPTVKRRVQNVFLFLLGLFVAFMVVEIGFRVSGWLGAGKNKRSPGKQVVRMGEIVQVSSDPGLVYQYRPGIDTARYPRFTNSAGMRGPERSVARPANTIRIAGLGDSVMAGELYPAEQTFLFVLEEMLNEAATTPTRFEVLNFAVGGYNATQESIVLRRKALEYDPDWVILAVTINDWEPPVFFRMRGEDGQVRLADRYQKESRLRFGSGLNPDALPWWANSVAVRWVRSRFLWQHYTRAFRRAFRDIAETCRKNGVRMLVAILTEDVAVDQTTDPREKWHRIVRSAYDEAAAGDGDPVLLDTYPAIKAYLVENGIDSYEQFWTSAQDPHPNVEGHRLLARLLFEEFKSLGVLEQKPRPSRTDP